MRRRPARQQATQERQALLGQRVAAVGERTPHRHDGFQTLGGERLDDQRAAVADVHERVPQRRPVEVVGARGPTVVGADLDVRQPVAGRPEGGGRVTFLDVHVEGVERDRAPGRADRVHHLQGLLDGVEQAGLEPVERLQCHRHATLGGVVGDRSQRLAQAGHGAAPRRRVHQPLPPGRAVQRAGDHPRPHRGRGVHRRAQELFGAVARGRVVGEQVVVGTQAGTDGHPEAVGGQQLRRARRVPRARLLERQLDHVEPHRRDLGNQLRQPVVGQRRYPHPGVDPDVQHPSSRPVARSRRRLRTLAAPASGRAAAVPKLSTRAGLPAGQARPPPPGGPV